MVESQEYDCEIEALRAANNVNLLAVKNGKEEVVAIVETDVPTPKEEVILHLRPDPNGDLKTYAWFNPRLQSDEKLMPDVQRLALTMIGASLRMEGGDE